MRQIGRTREAVAGPTSAVSGPSPTAPSPGCSTSDRSPRAPRPAQHPFRQLVPSPLGQSAVGPQGADQTKARWATRTPWTPSPPPAGRAGEPCGSPRAGTLRSLPWASDARARASRTGAHLAPSGRTAQGLGGRHRAPGPSPHLPPPPLWVDWGGEAAGIGQAGLQAALGPVCIDLDGALKAGLSCPVPKAARDGRTARAAARQVRVGDDPSGRERR